MIRRFRLPPTFLAVILSLLAVAPAAAWEADGSIVCYAGQSQLDPAIVRDGADGAFVAWIDARNGPDDDDVYLQRVDAVGNRSWSYGGRPLCTAAGDQEGVVMLADGHGGAFVAWVDHRGADADVYAQRIDANGDPQWTADGVPVATADSDQLDPVLALDGLGGVIVAWTDGRNFGLDLSYDIYAQRLDGDGDALWTPGGTAAVSEAGAQQDAAIVGDGAGGCILGWEDSRNDTFENDLGWDVFAMRLSAAGGYAWEVEVVSEDWAQTDVRLAPAPEGGVFVVWTDYRAFDHRDVYASRVSGAGAVAWSVDGAPIASTDDDEFIADVVSDGADGFIVFWYRITTFHDVYAQRIGPDASPLWGTFGFRMATVTGVDLVLHAVPDGSGGAIAVWQTAYPLDPDEDIYTQRLDASGAELWTQEGLAVCSDDAPQLMPVLCADGAGGALYAWHDERNGTSGDIYGHRAAPGGVMVANEDDGGPAPAAPVVFGMSAHPNPFNPTVSIVVDAPLPGRVRVTIHDARGARVRTLLDGPLPAGRTPRRWDGTADDGRALPSGMYFARATDGSATVTTRLVLLR